MNIAVSTLEPVTALGLDHLAREKRAQTSLRILAAQAEKLRAYLWPANTVVFFEATMGEASDAVKSLECLLADAMGVLDEMRDAVKEADLPEE